MPLRIQSLIRDKEHISSLNHRPLSIDLKQTFRNRFEIPEEIPVDGILLDTLFLYPELRNKGLVPLLKSAQIDLFKERGPINPHEFNLPQLLEPGTLSVAMAEGYSRDHFQSLLRFDASPHVPIRYQTQRQHTETLMMVLSSTSVLGVLPFEFLQRIVEGGDHIVIYQLIPKQKGNIGYQSSIIYQLKWDLDNQVIDATKIEILNKSVTDYWKTNTEAWKKAIGESRGVFFVSD